MLKKNGHFKNAPVLLCTLFFSALALGGCEQARVDAQLEELCKKDGGMNIREKIILPKGMFTQNGDPQFFGKWNANSKSGNGYRITLSVSRIHENNPTLTKYRYEVIRESDQKILGAYIWYQRIGGDFLPKLGPDSSRTCPENASEVNFLKSVFVSQD